MVKMMMGKTPKNMANHAWEAIPSPKAKRKIG
jgi:hypothetical protein